MDNKTACVSRQETEKLESEQAKLQDDIKAFQREKDELEFILDAHRLHCGIGQNTATAAAADAATVATTGNEVKIEPSEGKIVVVVAGALPGHSVPDSVHLSAESTHLTTVSAPSVASAKAEDKSVTARRPNSLVAPAVSGSQVAGVSITTPSAGINVYTLGLESMLDGHTGLTPITGLPVSLAGLSTPIFAIPATVAGIAVEDTSAEAAATTSSTTSSTV